VLQTLAPLAIRRDEIWDMAQALARLACGHSEGLPGAWGMKPGDSSE